VQDLLTRCIVTVNPCPNLLETMMGCRADYWWNMLNPLSKRN
jgi:hypothetical protein